MIVARGDAPAKRTCKPIRQTAAVRANRPREPDRDQNSTTAETASKPGSSATSACRPIEQTAEWRSTGGLLRFATLQLVFSLNRPPSNKELKF